MQSILFVLFSIVIALVPLPLGSNRAWSWSPLAVIVGVLVLAWAVDAALRRDPTGKSLGLLRLLLWPAALFGLVVAWQAIQVSGWTPDSWGSSISAAAALGLPTPGARPISFDYEQSMIGIMRLLTYAGVFFLAVVLSTSGTAARRILAVIVCSAVIYTLYSMIAHVTNRLLPVSGIALWVPSEYFFTGPFFNANNYATYAGIVTLTALALAVRPAGAGGFRESAAQRWRRRLGALTGRTGFWSAAALIMAMGVLLSGSRAGWISLGIAVVTMVALFTRGVGRLAFTLVVLVTFAAAAVVMPAGRNLVMRMAKLAAEGESGREALFPMTLNAISLRPMVGWGANSFEDLYNVFQPVSLPEFFDKAHNTYLELAFDLGVPAALALVAAVAWLVLRCLVGFFSRGRDRELAGAGFLVAVMAGVHALFDFGLQIPGVACTFFAVLGVAWSQSWSSRA